MALQTRPADTLDPRLPSRVREDGGSVRDAAVEMHVVPAVGVLALLAQRPFGWESGLLGDPAGGAVLHRVDEFEPVQAEYLERPTPDRLYSARSNGPAPRGRHDSVGQLTDAIPEVKPLETDSPHELSGSGDRPVGTGLVLPAARPRLDPR